MTIAIALKVNDGLVLAADSASTLIAQAPSGEPAVINVYKRQQDLQPPQGSADRCYHVGCGQHRTSIDLDARERSSPTLHWRGPDASGVAPLIRSRIRFFRLPRGFESSCSRSITFVASSHGPRVSTARPWALLSRAIPPGLRWRRSTRS